MKIKYTTTTVVSLITFLLLLQAVVISVPVFAAPAGCYLGEGNGSSTYTETNCPTEDVDRAVEQYQTCYAVMLDGSLEERNCNRLEQSDNKTPESDAIGIGTGETSAAIETDCEPKDANGNSVALDRTNCKIIDWIVLGINFLSAVAGIAIVASLMIAGYIYMTAQDNAGQIEKAKSRIIQTLLALVLFIFMYALLNFLIPGGLGLA